tara:strand:- start:710 stop:2911 length:2202 start_codon:yes stop_codon:yes gene_type:complete
MIKKIIKILLSVLIILVVALLYLSYFGIETNRFNKIIKDKILENNNKVNIELNDVKIILNLKKFSVGLKTQDSIIIFEDKKISIDNIQTNFSVESFVKSEFAINNLSIKTKENNVKDLIKLARIYKNTPQLFILNKMTKKGKIIADISINFDSDGKIENDYFIEGKIKDVNLKLLNKKLVNKINLNFEIKDKNYLFKNNSIEYEKIKFFSKKIEIKDEIDYFLIQGNIANPEDPINFDLLSSYLNYKNSDFSNLIIFSNNDFKFKLNKKFKFSDLNLKSKIDLKNLDYKTKNLYLKNYLPNFKGSILLKDHNIILNYSKKDFFITGKGNYFFDKNEDQINYNVKLSNNDYEFESEIQFNNNPLLIKILDYSKVENKNSSLKFKGIYKKNKSLFLKKVLFQESKNQILIEELSLNEKFKVNYVKNLELDILNSNKKLNKISFKKIKKNYEVIGKIFDASIIIDEILEGDSNNEELSIFNNLNTNIIVKIDKTFIDKISYINNLRGSINFNKNKINELKLESFFSNNRKINLTIIKNENDEKVTTLFSDYPRPLVKRYKFIKGFEDGVLDFQSIKKNNVSRSELRIDNFKVKEVPVLAKLLSLASLQGIADLLTGEGIRFTDFEMIFSNKNKTMTIDEIYAIGPAISIMMSGYIQNNDLISLRGTLVPARTINRTIASIPLIGDILIGKKVGEGVFGVSFKIKGPPKDLKTTVNPIKTLTPRFITRTLEKLKKTN